MSDKWVAECLLCKWEAHFDTQNEAVLAAEEHVADQHRKIPAAQRAAQKIGHVQLRTILPNDAHAPISAGEGAPGPDRGLPEPGQQPDPAEHPTKPDDEEAEFEPRKAKRKG